MRINYFSLKSTLTKPEYDHFNVNCSESNINRMNVNDIEILCERIL